MRIEQLASGSLMIRESWTLLRVSCVLGGCLLPLTLFFATSFDGSFGWKTMTGGTLGAMLLGSIAAVVDDSMEHDLEFRIERA